jgi:phosphatidylglycerophosphate synthase
MARRGRVVWLVQAVSLLRIVAGLLFACIAFQHVPRAVLLALYGSAMISDLVDGRLAIRLHATTHFGKVLDLVGDKSLTIVSLLYAAARGIALPPLAMIGTRDIVMIGMRLVAVGGSQLLPTNRVFGGMLAFVLWGNTLCLILTTKGTSAFDAEEVVYWLVALVFWANLVLRLKTSARRITASLDEEL